MVSGWWFGWLWSTTDDEHDDDDDNDASGDDDDKGDDNGDDDGDGIGPATPPSPLLAQPFLLVRSGILASRYSLRAASAPPTIHSDIARQARRGR